MFSDNLKKKKGFTLIELLIVILMISVGIAGVANLTFQVILYTRVISSKLIAAYLAQEAMEVVRNIRDTNWLEDIAWDTGIGVGDFQLEYDDQILTPYTDQVLKYGGNVYNHQSGGNTKFKRKINIQKPSPQEMNVSVTVSWAEMGRSFEVEAFERLYNWRWW